MSFVHLSSVHILVWLLFSEAVVRSFFQKVFFNISENLEEKTCAGDSFFNKVEACHRPASSLKETPAQVFSYEFCGTFKNTYFEDHLQPLLLFFVAVIFIDFHCTLFTENASGIS